MNIKITGQSGYLGNLVKNVLSQNGHNVSPIKRSQLYGDIEQLQNEISGTDVVIHLAGSPILTRWNQKNKKMITDSRVVTTQNLTKAIAILHPEHRPKKLIQASAIGIYKAYNNHGEQSLNFDTGFVGTVVAQWENASADLPVDVEKVIFRIGLVIGKNAKTITNLVLPFRLGLGAKIGNGNQPFPFIHDSDVAAAFVWATENDSAKGIYNLVAPQQITNKQFTAAFAKTLNRPAFFSIPQFTLKIALGEAAVLLTEIPSVTPEKLVNAGFRFQFPTIELALKEILHQ